MPFDTVILNPPGVRTVQTPTLLKTNVVAANLIRWKGGLPEKLGGWVNFLSQFFAPSNPLYSVPGITRALHAWADNNGGQHLGIAGNSNYPPNGTGLLNVVTHFEGGNPNPPQDITPLFHISTGVASIASTAGSTSFVIDDPGLSLSSFPIPVPSSIDIQTHVAIGGVVLYGNYPITAVTSGSSGGQKITIAANVSALGTQTLTTNYTAQFSMTAGSDTVTVTLPNHGLNPGSNFSIVIPTPIGTAPNQITLSGFYTVVSVAPVVTSQASAQTLTTSNVLNFSGAAGSTTAGIVAGMTIEDLTQPLAIPFGTTVSSVTSTTVTMSANPVATVNALDEIQFTASPDWFTIKAGAAQQTAGTSTAWEGGSGNGSAEICYWPTFPPGSTKWGSTFPPPANSMVQFGFANASPDSWDLHNFGSFLFSCPINGPIFGWNALSNNQNSSVLNNAPQRNRGFFIAMPQQMVVAFASATGGVEDPMLVSWSDSGTFSVWVASPLNQAGTFRLTRGSRIIEGIQGPQAAMLWTDVGLWLMTYVGYPDVWGFNEIAQGCGIIAKDAWCVHGPQIFWMGHEGFWVFANGAVQRLDCDVWDIVIKNLNATQNPAGQFSYIGHIRGASNSDYDEVAWHFPSTASTTGENDSYVKYNVLTREWDYALSVPQTGLSAPTPIQVTAWLDQNILGLPISSMLNTTPSPPQSMIMQHETSPDANGQALTWMIQTGFFMLQDGEDKVFVDYMIPDFTWRRFNQAKTVSATVQLTLYVADYPDNPNQPPVALGPYTVTNATGAIEIRCRGRYFAIQMQGSDLGSWLRLGGIKFRFSPDGRN